MTHEMDQGSAIIAIVIGSVIIVGSFFIKNFYAANNISVSDKQIPTWMGRLLACMIGGMFILMGAMFFFPNQ